MLTSKERSKLIGLSSKLDTIMQVGKDGVKDSLIKTLSDALEAKELIKISVLNNCSDDKEDVADTIASALGAEKVAVIGKKVILYRKSSRKNITHIEL